MAAKIGKREKIVIGSITGIAVILAVHFFVFRTKAATFNRIKDERNSRVDEAAQYQDVRDEKAIDEFRAASKKKERTMWEAIVKMDLFTPYFFYHVPPPEEPEDGSDEEADLQGQADPL